MSVGFDLAQTFFIDAAASLNSQTVFITSIDLYFYAKPVAFKTQSGIPKPGVSVYIAECTDSGTPIVDRVHELYSARKTYGQINVSTVGATATTFVFNRPIQLTTNRTYAFLVHFDGSDSGFKLFYNKAGENVLGTTTKTNVSSGRVDGSMFVVTNGTSLTPTKDADLSFRIRVAKFSTSPTTFKTRNRPVEIIKSYNIVGRFKGGEKVYEKRSPATGTVNIIPASNTLTGTGTLFSSQLNAGDTFVITDGTAVNTNIRTVVSVANNTSLVLSERPSFTAASGTYYRTVTGEVMESDNISDILLIDNSTANSTVSLSVDNTIYGVDSRATANIQVISGYLVNSVVPNFKVTRPRDTQVTSTLNFANSSYVVSGSTVRDTTQGKRLDIDQYPAIIASASIERTTGTPFYSSAGTLTFTTDNPYVSPMVTQDNLDVFAETLSINNNDTNEYLGKGNALARYVSKVVTLAESQHAEDIKVYLRGYKPTGTNIKAYVRLKNGSDSEGMASKQWTEMSSDDVGVYSSSLTNKNDFAEFSYYLPFFHSGTPQSGTFTSTLSSAVLTGTSGTVNTGIVVGDVVRLYSPLFATNYLIDTVIAANTTTLTLGTAITNASMVSTGLLLDRVQRPRAAFIDIQNRNIVTYFNDTGARVVGFDTFQIKLVLLSETGLAVPRVADLRAIAVSA